MPSPYSLSVKYGETDFLRHDLGYWGAPLKERLRQLAEQALGNSRELPFSHIAGFHLCDATLWFGEDFCLKPDWSLDAYWAAKRGAPTVFPPLIVAKNPKEYQKMMALATIAEGVAGYILEDPWKDPTALDAHLLCRPLGTPPDMIMFYRTRPGRLLLVEVKSTESADAEERAKQAVERAKEAVKGLSEVLQGWFLHRSVVATDVVAVGVTTSCDATGPLVDVAVLKLVDIQGVESKMPFAVGGRAMHGLWAGDFKSAHRDLAEVAAALRQAQVPQQVMDELTRLQRRLEEIDAQGVEHPGVAEVSDSVEARSYSGRPIEPLDMTRMAVELERDEYEVTERTERGLAVRRDALEAHIFCDGRIRVIGPRERRNEAIEIRDQISSVVQTGIRRPPF